MANPYPPDLSLGGRVSSIDEESNQNELNTDGSARHNASNSTIDVERDNASNTASDSGNAIPIQDTESSIDGGETETETYIESFTSRRHMMPHWRNVLSSPRNDDCGSVDLLSFSRSAGPDGGVLALQPIARLDALNLRPRALAAALGPDYQAHRNPGLKAVFVTDLCKPLINSLGPIFHLSPEAFEEHLVGSGYTAESYEEADPSTWPTRFLHRQHVSLRWHSLVLRENMEPRDAHMRRLLLNNELEWKRSFTRGRVRKRLEWHKRFLFTLTNIFCQEWSLSSVYRPMKRRLVKSDETPRPALVDVGDGDGDELEEPDQLDRLPESEMDIVAWEERVTFCWGSWGQGRVPILLFDPLPRMRMNNQRMPGRHGKEVDLMPFPKRLSPRGPPPVQLFDHNPAAVDAVSEYITRTNDARSDVVAWLGYIAGRPIGDQGIASVDLVLLAVLQVVRQDTEVFLGHIASVLDQISHGSMDERMMQEQLEHWRTVLSRLQSELPTLKRSIGDFFAFPYLEWEAGEAKQPPPQLAASLAKLQADIATNTARCQEVQQSLRAEMSLLESKRGIEEAESVSRLTELAFIFIPITFAAGLFSMQIKELADEPAPAWAFVIAAVIAVTVSYSLRLVQRSTVVSEVLHKWKDEIRREQEVTTRAIPIRSVARWLAWKLRVRLAIAFLGGGGSILFLAPLWTRRGMDLSFKGAMTGFVLLGLLGLAGCVIWVVDWSGEGILQNRGNKVFGFGRMWRAPPRNMDRQASGSPEPVGAATGGQNGSGMETQSQV